MSETQGDAVGDSHDDEWQAALDRALAAKETQRRRSESKSIAEKLELIERMRERARQIGLAREAWRPRDAPRDAGD